MSLSCIRPAFFRSVALFLLPAISVHAAAPVTAGNAVKVTDCSFGEVYASSVAACSFTLENAGSKPVSLSVTPLNPGNTVEPASLNLPPGSSAKVAARVLTDNIAGAITSSFRVEGTAEPPVLVHAQGFVMSVLDNPRPKIDFGDIDGVKAPIRKSIELTSSAVQDVRIEKVLSSPSFLRAEVKDSRTLVAEIDKNAPWGLFDETIKLAIDTPQQKQVWVEATGNVIGDVGPQMNPYWFGSIPWQPSRTLTLPLMDRDGRDFTIGAVTAGDFAATFDSAECDPVRHGCRALRIHVADSQAPGFFRTNLDVRLPDRGRHLALTIWGVLAGKPVSELKGASSSPDKSKSPLREANDNASPPPLKTQPEPPGEGPLLKWTVAQQGSVYGYQVFRGDSPEGPFTLASSQTILVIDNDRGPVKYQWRDAEAVKGRTYWYYIAIVYKNGVRQALSGAQKTVAK